jgi:hypothetical protein
MKHLTFGEVRQRLQIGDHVDAIPDTHVAVWVTPEVLERLMELHVLEFHRTGDDVPLGELIARMAADKCPPST